LSEYGFFKTDAQNPTVPPITVMLNERGMLKECGAWVPPKTVPLHPAISDQAAKTSLIGKTFQYVKFSGGRGTFQVTEESLTEPASKALLIKASLTGHRLEVRLAWKIAVDQQMWTVYLDAMTFEELMTVQNFRT